MVVYFHPKTPPHHQASPPPQCLKLTVKIPLPHLPLPHLPLPLPPKPLLPNLMNLTSNPPLPLPPLYPLPLLRIPHPLFNLIPTYIHPKLPPFHQTRFTGFVIGFVREIANIAYLVLKGKLQLKLGATTGGEAKKIGVPIMNMILQIIALFIEK